MSAQTFNTTSH